ncbi:hypothetical protein uan_011 [Pseudomonas phage UAntarctica]|nr:hypothetical protein uan_011 [Pseudomonas phage UAntarctica]
MSTQLPYVFDLLYDFKTLEQLNDHLSGKCRCATSATDLELYQLANEHGVDCVKVDLKEPADKLAGLLKTLTRPEFGLMPDVVTKINDALKENGYGDH